MDMDNDDDDWVTSSDSETESSEDQNAEQFVSPPPSAEQQGDQDDEPGTSTPADMAEPKTMIARAYQREMYEESLKENIIVAMDTGSGKTQVAVLRIREELSRSEKRVWFLAPTVPLANQQHKVLETQIAGLQSRLICGSDHVEAWSTPQIWAQILHSIRVVVSTYQILFDAVSHGFVRLDSLSLIVMDEAHNCTKNNAVARLMREFYWPSKSAGLEVPHILGLTASPLMRTNLEDLDTLESTLDSLCRTPTKHRAELIARANRPQMHTVQYEVLVTAVSDTTPTMSRLSQVYHGLDITKDPLVLRLRADNTRRSRYKLTKVMQKRSTFCRREFRSFCNAASNMCHELGRWAADYYIHKVINDFIQNLEKRGSERIGDITDAERNYLAEMFAKVNPTLPAPIPSILSTKAQALVNVLASHQSGSVGIIFVKERATAAVLRHLLSVHPSTTPHFRVDSMVGISTRPGGMKNFLDLSRREDLISLDRFRLGKTNLLIATNVLEEGIDVPECNLVICFDKPNSLKSFVQRRGRARMSTSHLYLLVPGTSDASVETWKEFEEKMRQLYEDDMRQKKAFEELERSENPDYPILSVPATGARLSIDDAKRHLEHFCSTLCSRKYVDTTPYYVIQTCSGKTLNDDDPEPVKAVVHLPVSLVPELRRFESLRSWLSQDFAIKDAAFQAYKRLFEVGLVNDNLLPVRSTDFLPGIPTREGLAEVRAQLNPWLEIAQAWQRSHGELYTRRLSVMNNDETMFAEFDMTLPVPIPYMEPLTIHWNAASRWIITTSEEQKVDPRALGDSKPDHSLALLSMAYGHRQGWVHPEKRYPVRFQAVGRDLSLPDLSECEPSPSAMEGPSKGHLVREKGASDNPHYYQTWLPNKPPVEMVGRVRLPNIKNADFVYDLAPEGPYVVIKRWPKKAGFFRLADLTVPLPSNKKPYPRIHPASLLKVDAIPPVYAHFGMLIPALTTALETHLVASDLIAGPLEKLNFTDLSQAITATSATSARLWTDYERVEFLGDAVLKLVATVNVCAQNPLLPEGMLSHLKDRLVSNSTLFRCAADAGLDKYIISRPVATRKWQHIEDLVEINPKDQMDKRRELPTKMCADVVESLIGIAFMQGGVEKALDTMAHFIPMPSKMEWQDIGLGWQTLFDRALDIPLPVTLRPVEQIIGYTFKKKGLLVEALTHPSYNVPGVDACFERLEFLGDAVLDYIVVKALFEGGGLKNSQMHTLKTTLVNADILAFFMMEWMIEEERVDPVIVVEDSSSRESSDDEEERPRKRAKAAALEFKQVRSTVRHPLWSFMRHASPEIGLLQRETEKRHQEMREGIHEALRGDKYPWVPLIKMRAAKYYSDLFEGLLGAVWVDSGGDFEACQRFLENAALMPLMRRLQSGNVHLYHPKEELGWLAGNQTVRYDVEERVLEGEDDEQIREYGCQVKVGDALVAEIWGAANKEEARCMAADEAVTAIKLPKLSKDGDVLMEDADADVDGGATI
ncbi:hypothetical protein OQA88_11383 [Cercophora sp. LCS_1]